MNPKGTGTPPKNSTQSKCQSLRKMIVKVRFYANISIFLMEKLDWGTGQTIKC